MNHREKLDEYLRNALFEIKSEYPGASIVSVDLRWVDGKKVMVGEIHMVRTVNVTLPEELWMGESEPEGDG